MLLFATVENGNAIFNFFENNLLNWFVLVGLVGWLWMKYMPGVFASRQQSITTAIADAARARAEGEAFFRVQKEKIASAEKEADNILAEAVQVAKQMKEEMEKQTAREVADLKARIEQEIANERQLAISQLRSAAAKAAITLSGAALPPAITDSARARLLDQFLAELEVVRK